MPRPQNRTSNSVSLFPFLAVLVCAMGALIFLLIVTTRRVRSDAIARAEHVHSIPPVEEPLPVPAPVEEIDPPKPIFIAKPVPKQKSFVKAKPRPIDPDIALKLELASLNRERNQRRIQLAEKKTDWSVARERLRSTESKLNSATRRKRQAAEELLQHHERQQSTVEGQQKLSEHIKKTEERLEHLRRANAEKEGRYSLIPYDGRSGTTRKPIFIECSGSGMKFLPEGVALRPDDLNGFTLESNPLLAGARSLIEYWSDKSDRNNDPEDQAEPYVLLLVRPSGSVAYYAARKLLSRLEHQYGYELIEEDWKLEFPDADPESRRICRTAVTEAMAEKRERGGSLIVATRAGRGGKMIRFDRGSGTFEVIEPDDSSASSTSESGKGAWKQNPGEVGGDFSSEKGPNASPSGRNSRYAEGRGSNEFAGNQPSFGANQQIEGNSPFRNGERNGISTGFRGDETQNGAFRGKDLSNGFDTANSSTGDSFLSSKQQGRFPGNPGGTTKADGPQFPADPLAQGAEFSRSTDVDHRFPKPLSATGSRSDQGRSSSPERPFAWADIGNDGRDESVSEEWSSTRHRLSESGTGNGKKREFESPGNPAASGMSKTAEKGNAQPHNPLDDLDRAEPRLPSRLSSNSATGNSSPSSGSSGTASPFSPDSRAGSQAQSSMQFGSKSALPPQRQKTSRLDDSSSKRFRRRRWGYSDYGASIGFEREVVISVDAQSLVVGRDYRIPLGPRDRVGDRLARRVLDGIEHQARLWGQPPSSFYWVPRVRFRTGEGGGEYVEQLRQPLKEAGLISRVDRNNESNRVTQQPE